MGLRAMPENSQKQIGNKKLTASEARRGKASVEKVKSIKENSLLEIAIGSLNVKRWLVLRSSFSCDNNKKFATKLLDIAQEHLNRYVFGFVRRSRLSVVGGTWAIFWKLSALGGRHFCVCMRGWS